MQELRETGRQLQDGTRQLTQGVKQTVEPVEEAIAEHDADGGAQVGQDEQQARDDHHGRGQCPAPGDS